MAAVPPALAAALPLLLEALPLREALQLATACGLGASGLARVARLRADFAGGLEPTSLPVVSPSGHG
jgi:hypothetical protein